MNAMSIWPNRLHPPEIPRASGFSSSTERLSISMAHCRLLTSDILSRRGRVHLLSFHDKQTDLPQPHQGPAVVPESTVSHSSRGSSAVRLRFVCGSRAVDEWRLPRSVARKRRQGSSENILVNKWQNYYESLLRPTIIRFPDASWRAHYRLQVEAQIEKAEPK